MTAVSAAHLPGRLAVAALRRLLCALLLSSKTWSWPHLPLPVSGNPAATQVLGIYPSTIRRRILRHLYLDQLHKCFLFSDCKLKFLDAILAGARVELFMPQVRWRLTCDPRIAASCMGGIQTR